MSVRDEQPQRAPARDARLQPESRGRSSRVDPPAATIRDCVRSRFNHIQPIPAMPAQFRILYVHSLLPASPRSQDPPRYTTFRRLTQGDLLTKRLRHALLASQSEKFDHVLRLHQLSRTPLTSVGPPNVCQQHRARVSPPRRM